MSHVYRAINRPSLAFGIERRLFVAGMVAALLVYLSSGSLLAGVVSFVVFSIVARLLTKEDPQMFVVVLSAVWRKKMYDAGLG